MVVSFACLNNKKYYLCLQVVEEKGGCYYMSFHTTTLYEPHSNMSLEFTRKQSIKYSFLLDPQLQKKNSLCSQVKKEVCLAH